MEKTKVSIVCITYNHEKYIKDALDSFVMQKTSFPFEVIISDDCSTDDTARIVQEYAQKYPEIIKPILREKNIGLLPNFIDTLSLAKSEYVIYVEGDDYFTDPLKLQKQADFLDTDPEYSICFHNTKIVFQDEDLPELIFPSPKERFNKTKLALDDIVKENFMQTSSVMYRWAFVDKNPGIKNVFPTNILPADWFLHIIHAKRGKIGFIDETMSAYRRHKGGIWYDGLNNVDKLILKHGIEMLNFYYLVYRTITNSSALYCEQKFEPFLKQTISVYLKNKKFDKLGIIANSYDELYEHAVEELSSNKKLENTIKKYKKRWTIFLIATIFLLILLITSGILFYKF